MKATAQFGTPAASPEEGQEGQDGFNAQTPDFNERRSEKGDTPEECNTFGVSPDSSDKMKATAQFGTPPASHEDQKNDLNISNQGQQVDDESGHDLSRAYSIINLTGVNPPENAELIQTGNKVTDTNNILKELDLSALDAEQSNIPEGGKPTSNAGGSVEESVTTKKEGTFLPEIKFEDVYYVYKEDDTNATLKPEDCFIGGKEYKNTDFNPEYYMIMDNTEDEEERRRSKRRYNPKLDLDTTSQHNPLINSN